MAIENPTEEELLKYRNYFYCQGCNSLLDGSQLGPTKECANCKAQGPQPLRMTFNTEGVDEWYTD